MNLEYIEQRCLKYLKQSRNPLVPLEHLLEHCGKDEACAGVTEKLLLDFLRRHEEVRVLEGPGASEPVSVDAFAAAGLLMGTRVIHRERVPAQTEITAMLKEHAAGLLEALNAAMNRPEIASDAARRVEIEAAIARARELQGKIEALP